MIYRKKNNNKKILFFLFYFTHGYAFINKSNIIKKKQKQKKICHFNLINYLLFVTFYSLLYTITTI